MNTGISVAKNRENRNFFKEKEKKTAYEPCLHVHSFIRTFNDHRVTVLQPINNLTVNLYCFVKQKVLGHIAHLRNGSNQ